MNGESWKARTILRILLDSSEWIFTWYSNITDSSHFLNRMGAILPHIWFVGPDFPSLTGSYSYGSTSMNNSFALFFFLMEIVNFQNTTIKNNILITRSNTCWMWRQNILGALLVNRISLDAPTALSTVSYTAQIIKSIWCCCICILTSSFLS